MVGNTFQVGEKAAATCGIIHIIVATRVRNFIATLNKGRDKCDSLLWRGAPIHWDLYPTDWNIIKQICCWDIQEVKRLHAFFPIFSQFVLYVEGQTYEQSTYLTHLLWLNCGIGYINSKLLQWSAGKNLADINEMNVVKNLKKDR